MIIDFPTTLTLVTKIGWGQMRRDIAFESAFGAQSVGLSYPLWTALLTPARFDLTEYAEWESILLQLDGLQNQLALWHIDRPQPRGTMRGAMVLNGAHSQGAAILNISAGVGQAGKTLLTGDHIGFGTGATQQVCKVQASATADVNGDIAVAVKAPLRNDFPTGTAVVWDKPKALFRRRSSELSMEHYRGGVDGTALDLIEDWRP